MKQWVCLMCAVSFVVFSFAQTSSLQITTDKTTSLIFPYPIKHVDRGTKDVLVQAVQEADNILLVKAAAKDFNPTNLSVVTGDGSVYSFGLCYGEPAEWVYRFPVQLKTAISTYATAVLDNPKTMAGMKDTHWDMVATVSGIYIKDDVFYYQLDLENASPIDYGIDFLRFYIRDKNKAKRTAIQDNELTPLYVAGKTSQVKANSHNAIVVAIEKFTIPDGKDFVIDIGEKDGGRNLLVRVTSRKMLKAISLPDLR